MLLTPPLVGVQVTGPTKKRESASSLNSLFTVCVPVLGGGGAAAFIFVQEVVPHPLRRIESKDLMLAVLRKRAGIERKAAECSTTQKQANTSADEWTRILPCLCVSQLEEKDSDLIGISVTRMTRMMQCGVK